VDLGCGFDQILKVGAGEEVSEVDKFAVVLVLDIDDSPSVLTATDLLAPDDDWLLRPNNRERDDVLYMTLLYKLAWGALVLTNLDLSIQSTLLLVELIVVVWVHLQVVERKLLLYALLEGTSLLERQRIRLGNDWDDVDHIRELLQDNNVDWLQCVTWRLDEEKAAVDAGILDVSFSLSSEFLSEVCRVLVLDVLDNWVPASVVVDLVTVTRGINNVQAQTDAVLLNDVGNSLDLGGRSYGLIGSESSFRVDQVRREDGVDQGRFSQTGLALNTSKVRTCSRE
jgi:hypothetical protein